jgi:hypothetical protein
MPTLNSPSRRRFFALPLVVALAVVAALLSVVGTTPAAATAPPLITPPACLKVTFGSQVNCVDMRPNGTWSSQGAGTPTMTISGTVTAGGQFSATLKPGIPPCASTSSVGCYNQVYTSMPTVMYSVRYSE